MPKILLALVLSTTVLSGCMSTDSERALIGAATGAALASATGGDVATGAIAGAAAGAICDEITNVCQ